MSEAQTATRHMSIKELEDEIKRRKEEEKRGTRPAPKKDPDFSGLIKMIEGCFDEAAKGERVKDFKEYVFEDAIIAIYGGDKAVWKWINNSGVLGC